MTVMEVPGGTRPVSAEDPLQLLLIEDNRVDATLIKAMLAETMGAGFNCTWVKTLAKGLAALAESTTSCVLLDLNLPDAEGLGTLDAVLVAGSDPAVIVLTGVNNDQTGRDAMARGAQDYLDKGKTDAAMFTGPSVTPSNGSGLSGRCVTRRFMTSSPVWPTGPCSLSAFRRRSRAGPDRRGMSWYCSWISTGSSGSTTALGTKPATRS